MHTVFYQEISTLKESEKRLQEENKKQKKKIEFLEKNVEALTQALLQANKQRFGVSSEKTPDYCSQLSLFEDTEFFEKDIEDIPEKQVVRAHKRLKRKQGDKERLITDIPHETVEYVINQDEGCEICNSALEVIGKKKVRTELEFIPARVRAIEHVQYVYKCINCGNSDEFPESVIKKADVPAPVMLRSLASPTSVAWIMYQKYVLAVPLYRQEKEWLRMGIELSRSNMSNWVIQCAALWLQPIYEKMHEKLLTYEIVMSDETSYQCNKEKGKKASSKSYLWLHRNGECEGAPIILFQYTRTRSGENARLFLQGFSGFLVTDAFSGYEKVEDITRCLCWSHLRRYYIKAIPLDNRKKELPGSAGAIGRAYCNKLFKFEKKWKNLTPEERKQKRLEESVPILDAFFAWAKKVRTNQEPLKKALYYTLNHEEYFKNFLLDGRIPLSNNASENCIRPVALTRKNSLFSDTPRGAEASAIVFSIVGTAMANEIDPYEYLVYIFKILPNVDFKYEPEILDKYMPWSETLPDTCKMKKRKIIGEDINENT